MGLTLHLVPYDGSDPHAWEDPLKPTSTLEMMRTHAKILWQTLEIADGDDPAPVGATYSLLVLGLNPSCPSPSWVYFLSLLAPRTIQTVNFNGRLTIKATWAWCDHDGNSWRKVWIGAGRQQQTPDADQLRTPSFWSLHIADYHYPGIWQVFTGLQTQSLCRIHY